MAEQTPTDKLIQLVRAYVDPDDVPEGTIPELADCGCAEDGCHILSVRHGIIWFGGAWWRPDCLDEAFAERARELIDAILNQPVEVES